MIKLDLNIKSITLCSVKEHNVNRINSIKDKYKSLRQLSKSPTFALTYGGTWNTLVKNCGLSKDTAIQIESKYHELYKVSDNWVSNKMIQASLDGYVTCAFGLRVRTPKMKQSILNNKYTPKEVEAEKRTAGNALGQSWCLLNVRAGVEFNNRVRTSRYKEIIKPVGSIHDAQYFIIKNDIDLLLWVNKYLVKAVQWQEHPDIAHDKVKLGGELSIFYPDWAHELVVPNDITKKDLINITFKYKNELNKKKEK